MATAVQLYTNVLAGLMIASWAGVLLFWIIWFIEWKQHHLRKFLSEWTPVFLILFPLAGIIGSLMYSWGFGLPACDLCWWQRIFMYPLFIYGVIQYFEKKHNWLFPAIMSTLGLLIGIYNYLLQRGVLGHSVLCNGKGLVDCAKIDVQAFGFVTIPLLSLTFFFIVAVISWYKYRQAKAS